MSRKHELIVIQDLIQQSELGLLIRILKKQIVFLII